MLIPCPSCGYDLGAHVGSVADETFLCPECGEATSRAVLLREPMRAGWGWTYLIGGSIVSIVVFVIFMAWFRMASPREYEATILVPPIAWVVWTVTLTLLCQRLVRGPERAWHVGAMWAVAIVFGGCLGGAALLWIGVALALSGW